MLYRYMQMMLFSIAIATYVGCNSGTDGPPTYPVMGKVTVEGKPVEGVAVSFVPDGAGEAAVGVTDSTGTYKLTTRAKDDGAVSGSYKVTLAKYESKDEDEVTDPSDMHADYDISEEYPDEYDEAAASEEAISENVLPLKYADPASSGLTAEVKEGDNNFNFEINS